jgi:hypothetical protein
MDSRCCLSVALLEWLHAPPRIRNMTTDDAAWTPSLSSSVQHARRARTTANVDRSRTNGRSASAVVASLTRPIESSTSFLDQSRLGVTIAFTSASIWTLLTTATSSRWVHLYRAWERCDGAGLGELEAEVTRSHLCQPDDRQVS